MIRILEGNGKISRLWWGWRLGVQPARSICIDCDKTGWTTEVFASLLSNHVQGKWFTGAGTCIDCHNGVPIQRTIKQVKEMWAKDPYRKYLFREGLEVPAMLDLRPDIFEGCIDYEEHVDA